jgi:hypothetical protein
MKFLRNMGRYTLKYEIRYTWIINEPNYLIYIITWSNLDTSHLTPRTRNLGIHLTGDRWATLEKRKISCHAESFPLYLYTDIVSAVSTALMLATRSSDS